MRTSGLKDDTTCLVVDIIPSEHSVLPSSPKKNQNKLRSLLFGRRSQNTVGKLMNRPASVGAVEELFEEGSAMLEERFVSTCSNGTVSSVRYSGLVMVLSVAYNAYLLQLHSYELVYI